MYSIVFGMDGHNYVDEKWKLVDYTVIHYDILTHVVTGIVTQPTGNGNNQAAFLTAVRTYVGLL